jgi:hypothetical protein
LTGTTAPGGRALKRGGPDCRARAAAWPPEEHPGCIPAVCSGTIEESIFQPYEKLDYYKL